MATATERDYFTDHSVLLDPYDYFEDVRAHGPVHQLTGRDIVVVTGFREAVEVLLNTEDFSSSIAGPGPVVPLPFEPVGDDLTALIEAHRADNPAADLMVSYDGDRHAANRSLLNPLFTPSRLKANEEFMFGCADAMVREMVAKGGCEVINEVATPYVTLVIADLLGVPEEDRETFRKVIDSGPPPGNIDAAEESGASSALVFMGGFFARYIQERRENPRGDVMSDMANAKYPDGTPAEMMEVVKAAMFLFAAGQDTSAKLLGNALRLLSENQEMQQTLRADRSLISGFLEEVLRLEGSTKATFRLAKRNTRIGDVAIPAGKKVVVALAAANRDPRRWEDPQAFTLGRAKIREHLAFGRGAHTCAGAPLARVEVRVLLDRFLEHTSSISLSEAHHGTAGARRIAYEASYIIRGIEELHIELAP